MTVDVPIKPVLDPGFLPAALWNRAYETHVAAAPHGRDVAIALQRPNGAGTDRYRTRVAETDDPLALFYLERLLKFLLWQRGGSHVQISGCDGLTQTLATIYSPDGARAFDARFMGEDVYGEPFRIMACKPGQLPEATVPAVSPGRHLDGCRIGFDLGGSDRKCAAVKDGQVVFSEEVEWHPYFEKDPAYHMEGIRDSLRRAAAHLPRVDAIGGSAAGVYVNNEVRVASLFRGVPRDVFNTSVRGIFRELQTEWGVPFVVVNDGEVTALAGSMSMDTNSLLGIAMGTSEATGYVTPAGNLTPWLNELAFAPVDYRSHAPCDEWSGDAGCGVQYFSQQAVARLTQPAGLAFPVDMPPPERLIATQERMAAGDERAERIYHTLGTYLGYSIAHYARFYDIGSILLLGRVTSGQGGTVIVEQAQQVLRQVFPELSEAIGIHTPNEKDKRHGQAVAAACLPTLEGNS